MQVWRNRQVLSEQTSESSTFLNDTRVFLKYVTQLWTAFVIFHISIRIIRHLE
jgi:hypothetical protein